MNSYDEYDVRCSFDAIDEDKIGEITLDQCYVLLLGLGFFNKTRLEKGELQRMVSSDPNHGSGITVDFVLRLVSEEKV